ncbi:MAG: patatin-like phospholipase family protein [Patescibacteria group bacterium]
MALKKYKKVGIVLSGGFFKGAFLVGAVSALDDFLRKNGIKASYIVGSSVGALVGAKAASGDFDGLLSGWRGLSRKDIWRLNWLEFKKIFFWKFRSFFSNAPLRNLLKKHVDFDALIHSPVDFEILTVALQEGDGKIFGNRQTPDAEYLLEALVASCAIPQMFTPSQIGDSQFADGGGDRKTPLNYAMKAGCDLIFVLAVDPEVIKTKVKFGNIFDVKKRFDEIRNNRNLRDDFKRAEEINNDIRARRTEISKLLRLLKSGKCDKKTRKNLMEIFEQSNFSFKKRREVKIVMIRPPFRLSKGMKITFTKKYIEKGIMLGQKITEKILREEFQTSRQ